ncbi:phosphoglycolate phosphatase [Halostella sp. JP-L12]|uniref:phosphoglycolate phosphatase n=1 Tax=Halostella TaxID=1843185 RepID=UPI000EF807BC|nr:MULTISPECIES: phosphoglycolate phosphatase [Halostella]NHN48732.1 phosphoglycolate phosphatase [Halostella sp. JP-L12]
MDVPPLALDIDGTLTRPDGGIDPRTFDAIRDWPADVVVATGKSFPYPVALCQFVGIEERVIAENGGVVCTRDEVSVEGDREAARAVAEEFVTLGHDLGWGDADLINRWRETEIAVRRTAPLEPLEELAADHGLTVVDTGYAYHVKSPVVSKGAGLEAICDLLGHDPEDFVAVGDSENDVSTFATVGRSFAVANADDAARTAADEITDGAHAAGFLEAIEAVRGE